MIFSQRLKEQRKANKITQTQLAAKMKVTQVSVSNWEKGLREPGYATLIKIAKFFGKSTDYMLGVKEE